MFFVTLSGCSTRNESGSLRVPMYRFAVKTSLKKDVYSIIDTGVLYVNIKINGLDSIETGFGQFINVASRRNSLKFYANGRVASFQNVDLKSPHSLNPARARMGMYGEWGARNGYYAQFVSQSPQAGIFLLKDKIRIDGDTLYLDDGKFDYAYIKRKIPEESLIYKPDW